MFLINRYCAPYNKDILILFWGIAAQSLEPGTGFLFMIGIYKITNPVGGVYIGQSKRAHDRIRDHKAGFSLTKTSKHRLLKKSFKQHGVSNHTFEVIHECTLEELDKWEVYYISFYNSCLGENGLNCQTGGKSGYKWNPNLIQEFRDFGKMNIFTDEHRAKISNSLTGKKRTAETHAKLMDIFKGHEKKFRDAANEANRKKVIDTKTGVIYDGIKIAAKELNMSHSTLGQYLSGYRTNKTSLQYL